MKKIWLAAALFVLSNPSLFCAPLTTSSAAIPLNAGQVGIVAGVRGVVKVTNQTQVGKVLESGAPIYLGDTIATDEKSNLQILLLDETIFTIGPQSAIVIDKFIYDPATQNGEVKAKVVKGVFRFVTGKIARKKPSQMEVELPAGTIGIRGTIVAGESVGKKSTIVLLGPGENNNTPHRIGSFVLGNEINGAVNEQVVNKSGFGSVIEGEGIPPTAPFKVPSEQLNRLANALAANPSESSQNSGGGESGGSGPGKGESPSEQSGQSTALASQSIAAEKGIGQMIQQVGDESTKASQENFDTTAESIFEKFDGFTTYNQLEGLAQQLGGTHHFKFDSFKLYDSSLNHIGTADFQLDINFSNRTVGGGNSKIEGSLTGGAVTGDFLFKLFMTPESFNSFGFGKLPVVFSEEDISNSTTGTACASGGCGKADVTVLLTNGGSASTIAHSALFLVDIKNTSDAVVANNLADHATREIGASPP